MENTNLTAEQEAAINKAKEQLVEQIYTTQDIISEYPLNEDGTRNFRVAPVDNPVSREDIRYLVDLYYDYRLKGISHDEACRLTYACCYRKSDVQFNPHARIEQIRAENEKEKTREEKINIKQKAITNNAKIEIEIGEYNSRRYGKPWIAQVDFAKNPKGEYHWGSYIGSDNGGLLVIDVPEGAIVARGQRDYRGNSTTQYWYQVRGGQLVRLDGGKAEAYKLAA